MTERILVGHFLTRSQAADRAHIRSSEVTLRPDLLRIGGTWLEEVYFEFQFDDVGVRHGLGAVVESLRKRFDDVAVADWLVRPHEELSATSPLHWAEAGGNAHRLARAASHAGPYPT